MIDIGIQVTRQLESSMGQENVARGKTNSLMVQDKVKDKGARHRIQRRKTKVKVKGTKHSDRHRTCVEKVQDIEWETDDLKSQARESHKSRSKT